jgi:hypothetical protein
LILIIISPNAASIFGREYGCFNSAREGAARDGKGTGENGEKVGGSTREQKGVGRSRRKQERAEKNRRE